MAYLVTSLKKVFDELNMTWPNRDHSTDGWIGDSRHCPGVSDHCADSKGAVHAIDIDKDGIDPMHVINKLSNADNVIRYMNYNYKQYHVRDNFQPRPLGGSDPHTSHIHVSIEHTSYAENYQGPYGIFAPISNIVYTIPGIVTVQDELWGHTELVLQVGGDFADAGSRMGGFSSAISGLRNI